MDEATSAINPDEETQLYANIDNSSSRTTVFRCPSNIRAIITVTVIVLVFVGVGFILVTFNTVTTSSPATKRRTLKQQ